jgi:hypothetical protein
MRTFTEIVMGLLTAVVLSALMTAEVYAQTTTLPPSLQTPPGLSMDITSDPTVSDRIEAAETNTDIDLQRIDGILLQVSTEYVPILREATLAGDTATSSDYRNQIDSSMWDIHLELSYVTPDQVELVNVVENETATDTVLNVTYVDDSAVKIQEILGTLFAIQLFEDPLTQNDIEAIADRIQFHVQNMRNEISFSAPPEDVEIIGGMWVPIEELRALEAELNPPSTLVLP